MSVLANELLRTISDSQKDFEKSSRLAKVETVDEAGVYVTFYGEDIMSQMPYKRVSSCEPRTGDTVIMQKIGTSYIITGKVE